MDRLKIHLYRAGKTEPETVVTVCVAGLRTALRVLPRKVKETLAREGIDLVELAQTSAEDCPAGVLLEVENAVERLTVSLE